MEVVKAGVISLRAKHSTDAAELIVNAQLDQFVELPVAKEANIMNTSGTARGPLCSLRI